MTHFFSFLGGGLIDLNLAVKAAIILDVVLVRGILVLIIILICVNLGLRELMLMMMNLLYQ